MKYKQYQKKGIQSLLSRTPWQLRSTIEGYSIQWHDIFPDKERINFKNPKIEKIQKSIEDLEKENQLLNTKINDAENELTHAQSDLLGMKIEGYSTEAINAKKTTIQHLKNKIQDYQAESKANAELLYNLQKMLSDDEQFDEEREKFRKEVLKNLNDLAPGLINDCLQLQEKIIEFAEIAFSLYLSRINQDAFYIRDGIPTLIPDFVVPLKEFTDSMIRAASVNQYIGERDFNKKYGGK